MFRARLAMMTVSNHKKPLLFAVGFGVIGVILVVSSFAASDKGVHLEAEESQINGQLYINNDDAASGQTYVVFGQDAEGCPVGEFGIAPNCFNSDSVLGVNARVVVNDFDDSIKGMAFGNWTFGWGRPLLNEIAPLKDIVKAIEPGLLRYAGGLWANYVGYDGNERDPYTNYTVRGNTYSFTYSPRELLDLDGFAKAVDAEVMIQVNISQNDPQMWADLAQFIEDNNLTNITSFELGNELDLERYQGDTEVGITTTEYKSRVSSYQQAIKAVKSNAKIVGGVPAAASDQFYSGDWSGITNVSQYIPAALEGARDAGQDLDSVSFHWYQTSGDVDVENVREWSWGINPNDNEFWRESYTRAWSGKVAPWVKEDTMTSYPDVKLGVSELGINSSNDIPANGNHIGAIWYSDVLGRLAYSGVDWITQWDTYINPGSDSESFSLLYSDNEYTNNPNIQMRPTFMAYLMYEQYFGDQLVESSSYNNSDISIWASKDSEDPNKLKLRITNFSDQTINTPVAWNGFSAASGQTYLLSSSNPTANNAESARSSAPTTINGVRVNGNDIDSDIASILPNDIDVNSHHVNVSLPAYTSMSLVLDGSFN